MKTKKWSLSLIVSTMLMVLFFCSAASVQAAPKGDATYVNHSGTWELRTAFDPHTATGGTAPSLISIAFDGLAAKDLKGGLQPSLAKSWEIDPDWSFVDFNLRKGVAFHNGDLFSAKDVKFSIDRAMREDMQFVFGPELRRNIASVEILDDYKVRVHLKGPYPAFLDRTAEYIAIVPKAYIEKVGAEGFAAKPIGTGPFRVISFERDTVIELEALDHHFRMTPHVKRLTHKLVPEPSTRLAMLKTGEADVVTISPAQIPVVKRDPELTLSFNKHTYLNSLVFFDLSHPEDSPFKDPRVREATSLAIDREGIARALGNGALEPWGSFLAPYHPGFDPNKKPDPYDPEKAKRLLAEAGYPNGFETVLTTHPAAKAWFEAMQQQLADVGIRASLQAPEAGTWGASFVAGNYRGIGLGTGPWWVGRVHPESSLESHITGNWSHNLATADVKKAMDDLKNGIGEEAIAENARKLDDILLEQTRRVPLWSHHMPLSFGPRVAEFPGVPGLFFPQGFENLKLKE